MTDIFLLILLWFLGVCIGWAVGRTLLAMKISNHLDRMADERQEVRRQT